MGFLRCPALPCPELARQSQHKAGQQREAASFPTSLGLFYQEGFQVSRGNRALNTSQTSRALGDPNQATHSLIRAPLKRMGGGGAGGGRRLSSN